MRESSQPVFSVLPPAQLEARHLAAWQEFLQADPSLASPLFSPEYALTLSSVVSQVSIGVAELQGVPVAFLPFERDTAGVGQRLHLCDYQGLIGQPGVSLDIRSMIRGLGLDAWDFDHLLAEQSCFIPFHRGLSVSPIMNLSAGYEAYVVERRAAGTETVKKTGNLTRRLEREIGPLRFEVHVPDPQILHQLLLWRASKYQDSRHPFELLENILLKFLAQPSPGCRGTLSVLYAGDAVVACHFGLRSRQTWHYWFPAYNPEFEKYSPGNILLLKIAELAATTGIHTIDLGKGEQDYKKRLMNGSVPLAEGSVPVSSLLSLRRSLKQGARSLLQRSPVLDSLTRRLLRSGDHPPQADAVRPS